MKNLKKTHKLTISLPSAEMEWEVGDDYATYIPSYSGERERRYIYSKIGSFWSEKGYTQDDEKMIVQILLRELAKELNES